jgi:hypothetical protein
MIDEKAYGLSGRACDAVSAAKRISDPKRMSD